MPEPHVSDERASASRNRRKPTGPAGRTLLINASFAPSLLNFRGRLIETLVARGHRVHVTAPDIGQSIAEDLEALGATPHKVAFARAGRNPIADLRYFLAIRALMRRIGPDLVLSYTIKPNIWASLASRSLGIPSASMITGLGYVFIAGRGFARKIAGFVSKALYRAATAANRVVIFQNPDDRADFIAAGCLRDPGKARMVNGSGVDLKVFAPAPLPDQPIFLMLTRLLGNKGVREYAAAALDILSRRRDCRFLLGGFVDDGPDGIDPRELEGWVSGGLEYLGPLEDVRPAIRRSSVYVLPSYREGTPRSVLEAMAMGRPIITTDVPGCRETVVDGVNGLLVPARDSASLAAAMERLIDQPGARARMGERSLELCRSKYDVDLVNAAMLRHLSLDDEKR